MSDDNEKTCQEEYDEEFEAGFWNKYEHQPDNLLSWCRYWEEE